MMETLLTTPRPLFRSTDDACDDGFTIDASGLTLIALYCTAQRYFQQNGCLPKLRNTLPLREFCAAHQDNSTLQSCTVNHKQASSSIRLVKLDCAVARGVDTREQNGTPRLAAAAAHLPQAYLCIHTRLDVN